MTATNSIPPPFQQPEDKSISIYRYLDLSKLIHLLDKKTIYLSRVDLLGDIYEGSIPKATKEKRDPKDFDSYIKLHEKLIHSTFVNSWCKSNDESYALWKLYTEPLSGVAIQTTYEDLSKSYDDSELYIGCIKYIDYLTEDFPDEIFYRYFMHKRKCFSYENEVRLIKSVPSTVESSKEMPQGIEIPISLDRIIKNIYVSPFSNEYHYQAVTSIISKYNPPLNQKIKWSSIKNKPIF